MKNEVYDLANVGVGVWLDHHKGPFLLGKKLLFGDLVSELDDLEPPSVDVEGVANIEILYFYGVVFDPFKMQLLSLQVNDLNGVVSRVEDEPEWFLHAR